MTKKLPKRSPRNNPGAAIAASVPALRPAVPKLARPVDEYTESLHLRMPAALLGEVNDLVNTRNAAGMRTERSALIRQAITEYLDRNREMAS